ncbi:DUF6913 domain-containing protein [Flavobacterium ardleyense]|uniref:DUF6913 domain-containing protein n=1 Tax=Flavobacterium ardleyense TaxID=2038737 RepID=A0ABW5ZA45_9FLAO
MFYTILKRFFLKKRVAKKLQKQQPPLEQQKISTIGVLVDEAYFSQASTLVKEIMNHGFKEEQIQVLVFREKNKPKEIIKEPFLTPKNISITGEISKPQVIAFLDTPFDMLINYYDVSKFSLMILSIRSKADFKVGFDAIDKRVNHLIIKGEVEKYKEYIAELFKYLKILNKI